MSEVDRDAIEASVVTIGVFDGVHRGHQRLISTAVSHAQELGVRSVAVTFNPHPVAVFAAERTPTRLNSFADRLNQLESLGVDAALVIDFRVELAGLSARDYAQQLLVDTLRAQRVVVGENFTFGAGGTATVEDLQSLGRELGFDVDVVGLLVDEGERICSTGVRDSLSAGNVERAGWGLGREFSLTGPIVHGAGRGGAELGYPTANQYFEDGVAVPADGVYAGWVVIHGEDEIDGDMEPGTRYPAAISVGTNPTFGDHERSVESFILDRRADLYGRDATVYFVDKVRDMVKFNSVEELLENMARDVRTTRQILHVD
ncbi:bifunctional riboflavin kinase/FAD synthetase [Corynebacterium tapiri]|uniref:Riboflavin biosynthesis protein n=1 Tax=Corynebacterium tapiri TaxID=1448266 RepID=A0A5C4U6Z9_9CORY|nr:bifunctional riboflavin kinase/FAD synthetase [Corynebacterium tapiri]TNL99455.1 bifunctional riboflavin kinase/FAD synthetase [Corynebacterium tapiri]